MAKLIILGSSYAVPDENHENTHMVIVGRDRTVLVDCVGNPTVRLQQAGVDQLSVTDLVLTHFHPDHVSGVPSFLMNSWLVGRKTPLDVYGLAHTLDRVKRLMDDYEWSSWPNFYPVNFHYLPEEEMTPVLNHTGMRVYASPVRHLIPTIGLRFEFRESDKVLAYSSDTKPCEEVVRLASGADLLIHEAAGEGIGHSSAAQAGEIARRAEVGGLMLIHYPVHNLDPQVLMKEAGQTFGGEVRLAEDFLQVPF